MNRQGQLFEAIGTFANLQVAYWKAARGHRRSLAAREFACDLDGNLSRLIHGLLEGTLPLGEATRFTIHDPKERVITAPCFRERVLHHAVMNQCEAVFERASIADSFACRRGKGRDAAVARARAFSARWPFFLKLDIRKYFQSIDHERLLARLGRLFKEERLLALFERIIGCHDLEKRGRGLAIGALTSQHFANHYLGALDRFVKEELRRKGYVRYMDDCLVWGESGRSLRSDLERVTGFLDRALDLAPKDTPYINRVGHGVDFLGCRVFPNRVVLNRRSRVRFRRRLHELEEGFLQGDIDERELQRRGTALVAFTSAAGVGDVRWRRVVVEQSPVGGQGPSSA